MPVTRHCQRDATGERSVSLAKIGVVVPRTSCGQRKRRFLPFAYCFDLAFCLTNGTIPDTDSSDGTGTCRRENGVSMTGFLLQKFSVTVG